MIVIPNEPLKVIPKVVFRNDSNTRYLQGLFFELSRDKSSVVYTLKDNDHLSFPSLYKLYMHTADLTEWNFAEWYMDGWEHWEMLTNCTWFKDYVTRWRKELEIKVRSAALADIILTAQTSTKDSFGANKLLLSGGWKSPEERKEEGRKVGRTTKNAINKQADLIVREKNDINKDFIKLGDYLG